MLSAHYHGADNFRPWLSFTLLCVYAVASLVVGGILLVRRDP